MRKTREPRGRSPHGVSLPDGGSGCEGGAGVITAVQQTKVTNGITGSFSILPSGDPSVGPITVSVAKNSFVPEKVVKPSAALVKAARQG